MSGNDGAEDESVIFVTVLSTCPGQDGIRLENMGKYNNSGKGQAVSLKSKSLFRDAISPCARPLTVVSHTTWKHR